MDHSWGLNVPDAGLGSLGATLAAPVLTGFYAGLWLLNNRIGDTAFLWQTPTLVLDIYTEYAAFIPGSPTSFPYGFDVPPDERL